LEDVASQHPYLAGLSQKTVGEFLREIGAADIWELYDDVPKKYIME